VSISIVYVYISDRVKRASFIESNRFRLASLKFFTSAISQSLQQKNQWRMDFMQQKALNSAAGPVPGQPEAEKEQLSAAHWAEVY